jgi:outer membrane receptor protein involved in Fe transport
MKKITLLLILNLCFGFAAFADGGTFSGKVIDSSTGDPLPQATLILYKESNNERVSAVPTDIDGFFRFDKIEYGKYKVDASYIGYKKQLLPISLTEQKPDVALTIKLSENILQGVTVTGDLTTMEVDIDKKTFYVNTGALTEGVSSAELLREIPSVEVDIEGNISLRNSENVDVFINGKSSGLTADNRGDILEQLPAGSIEKIEVITNPSAKFEAEGSSGIINIVLKKERQSGYFGSVTGGITFPANSKLGGNLGGNINYSSGKFDVFANVGLFDRNQKGGGKSNRLQYGNDTTFLDQVSENEIAMKAAFLRLGMDYRINDKNTIGISGMGSLGDRNREVEINYERGIYKNGAKYAPTIQQRNSTSAMKRGMYNVTLDYKHTFDKSGEELTTSFNISENKGDNESFYEQMNYGVAEDYVQWQNNENNTKQFEIQADYINPLTETSKMEVGYKSRFFRSESDAKSYLKNDAANAFKEQRELFNNFLWNQNIHALYATYANKINKFSLKVGLRGELTTGEWEQRITDEKSNTEPYFNLFPTLFFAYELPKNNELQLSYTRRITRPWQGMINPFVNVTDSANISFGNPDLQPEFANSIELNYLKTVNSHLFTASLYYKLTEDVIQHYSWLDEGVLKRTSSNLSRSHSYGVELIAKNKFKFFNLTSSVNLYYFMLEGGNFTVHETNRENEIIARNVSLNTTESFSWTARLMADIYLPLGITCQLSGNYRSPQVLAQGKSSHDYTINGGLKKQFLNKTLSVSLNVRDIFNTRKRKSEIEDVNFYQKSETYWSGRMINLNLTYSFGNMKFQRKEKLMENGNGNGNEMEVDFQ